MNGLAAVRSDPLMFVVICIFTVYFSGVALYNTSLPLWEGYDMWRVMVVSPVWPLLHLSERVDTWAKSGECTVPKDHPLREGQEVDE